MVGMLDDVVMRIKARADELRHRGIRHLSVFGSVARGEDRADSDVDIAIDIDPDRSFSLIRMEDTRLMLEGGWAALWIWVRSTAFVPLSAQRSSGTM